LSSTVRMRDVFGKYVEVVVAYFSVSPPHDFSRGTFGIQVKSLMELTTLDTTYDSMSIRLVYDTSQPTVSNEDDTITICSRLEDTIR
jgi:hypothetical protein